MEYYQLEPPEALLTTCGVQILVLADLPRGEGGQAFVTGYHSMESFQSGSVDLYN